MYTDVIENGSVFSELAVFEENYALLCNTVADIDVPLMKCLTEKKFLTAEEEKQIAAITTSPEKLRQLLQNISNSLKADNTRSFYIMVRIMKEHGGKGTQTLADHIMKRLKISSDKLLHICAGDIHEPKGLSMLI